MPVHRQRALRLQRLDRFGNGPWPHNGIVVSANPQSTSCVDRAWGLGAQRLDGAGAPQWGANGLSAWLLGLPRYLQAALVELAPAAAVPIGRSTARRWQLGYRGASGAEGVFAGLPPWPTLAAMESLVLPCPSCTTLNRLPASRVADGPKCSSCQHALLGGPVELDATAFDRVVAKTTLPVVVDFWAGWCGPCRQMAPHFAAAAGELAGRVVFAKVDTEAAPEIAARFAIQSIPTLVVLEQGREVRRQSGAVSKAALVQWLTGGR